MAKCKDCPAVIKDGWYEYAERDECPDALRHVYDKKCYAKHFPEEYRASEERAERFMQELLKTCGSIAIRDTYRAAKKLEKAMKEAYEE